MKLKATIVPDVEIKDKYGYYKPGPYAWRLDKVVCALYRRGREPDSFELGAPSIANPSFPVTLLGWHRINNLLKAVRLEIGDRKTAYRLWMLARIGYLDNALSLFGFKNIKPTDSVSGYSESNYTVKRHFRCVWRAAGLRDSDEHRAIVRLAGYSKFYRGNQLLPTHLPMRQNEPWIATEVECFFPPGTEKENLIEAFQNKKIWGICAKGDGSVQGPDRSYLTSELVLCRPRKDYERALQRFCDLIREMGGATNQTCGLHVHFDMRQVAPEALLKRAKRLDAHLDFARLCLPENRRESNYCMPGLSWTDRYRAVNLTSYQKFQTLEIRVHEGTANYEDIINWIHLCEALLAWPWYKANGHTLNYWLTRLPVGEIERKYWHNRAIRFSGQSALLIKVSREEDALKLSHEEEDQLNANASQRVARAQQEAQLAHERWERVQAESQVRAASQAQINPAWVDTQIQTTGPDEHGQYCTHFYRYPTITQAQLDAEMTAVERQGLGGTLGSTPPICAR